MQPLYGIGLERELPEAIVTHLPGYRGMGPVRVGNQAHEHFQHDVYGNIILAAAQAFHDHRLFRARATRDFAAPGGGGRAGLALHDQPDAGMWELRTRARIHTSSALMCWAACDRLAQDRARARLRRPRRVLARARRRDPRRASSSRRGTRSAGVRRKLRRQRPRRQRAADGRGRSSSPPTTRASSRPSRRSRRRCATARTCAATRRPTTSARRETAFNVCTFWRVDALARIGRTRARRARCSRRCSARRNPLGPAVGGHDPDDRRAVGQLPADLLDGRASSTARCGCRRRGTPGLGPVNAMGGLA